MPPTLPPAPAAASAASVTPACTVSCVFVVQLKLKKGATTTQFETTLALALIEPYRCAQS
jgi:hypothetical protein